MLNKDKVRGIMRAKQGSQIPKFQTPSGPLVLEQQNPFMVGSAVATPGIPGKLENPIGEQKEKEMELSRQAIFNTTNNQKRQLKLARGLARGTHMVSNGEVVLDGKQLVKNVGNAVGSFVKDNTTIVGQAATGLAGLAKNFSLKNPNLAGMGIDALGNMFDRGVTNNSGTQKIFGIGDTVANGLMMVNPVAGLIGKGVMTVAKGINNVFGKKTKNFSTDTKTIEEIGGSYGGSVADINEAASKANTKYGLFSSGSRKAANRLIDSADYQQDIMADIADDARNQRAMINDYNYLRYDNNLMGGYDQRYMRAAKSGMKLQDKIDFIKNEVNVNPFINLDTKEIEWNPIIEEIEEWEPVIEFKEGGSLPELWEPEIEIVEEWEPIITDYVEEFKDGGSIKEELETPEIEETNQKNLIPEGALHKNKHHMEHTEGLTQKGIPVIDNDGEQQAEIELDEIIFTLEVTKKLEELYKEGTDEAAIEAGKLLVKEILFNTDDRTGLIAKCEKGGKINEVE